MPTVDERELTATERGYMLREYLAEKPRKTKELQELLGYRSHSGIASLLCRLRVPGLARDDDGFWHITQRA